MAVLGSVDRDPNGEPIGYVPSDDDMQRLDNTFIYHAPKGNQKGNQKGRYLMLRNSARKLAFMMLECCPPSQERSVALTDLESAVMWANASIARNE